MLLFHVCVGVCKQELQLDRRLYEQAERLKAQLLMEVRRQLAWKQERCSIALRKLQDWYSCFYCLTLYIINSSK